MIYRIGRLDSWPEGILLGSEGLFAARQGWFTLSEEQRSAWMQLSLDVCEPPELLSWSEHLLYIGEKLG